MKTLEMILIHARIDYCRDTACRVPTLDNRSRFYLKWVLHTGVRKSELLNLKWSDIDFDRRTVTVQAKEDWHTKNYKSRTLQLTPMLYGVLGEHRKLLTQPGVQSEYVFTYHGVRFKCGIDACLRKVMKEAGLKNVTLHALRHTFASQLVMAGVPLREVQELMGHKSFETTLQYAHLSENHVKKQVSSSYLPMVEETPRHVSATRTKAKTLLLLLRKAKKKVAWLQIWRSSKPDFFAPSHFICISACHQTG